MFYNPKRQTINCMPMQNIPVQTPNQNQKQFSNHLNMNNTTNPSNDLLAFWKNQEEAILLHNKEMQKLNINAKILNQQLYTQNYETRQLQEIEGNWTEQGTPSQTIENRQITEEKTVELIRSKTERAKVTGKPTQVKSISQTYEAKEINSEARTVKPGATEDSDNTAFKCDAKTEHLRVHMNVEYLQVECLEMKLILKRELTLFLKKFREQYGNIKGYKVLLKSTDVDGPFLPNAKLDWESSNLSRDISPSAPFDKNAQGKMKSELANVITNSLLKISERDNHQKMLTQASKVVFKISDTLFKQPIPQFRNNFFRLFNTQVMIPDKLMDSLEVKDRVKILCYLFCKYFRKREIQNLYEPFLESVNFKKICPDSRSKKSGSFEKQYSNVTCRNNTDATPPSRETGNSRNLNPVLESLPQDIKISELFQGSQDSCDNLAVLRKVLILLIHHSSLFDLYLHLKTGTLLPNSFDAEEVSKLQNILHTRAFDENLPFKISKNLIHAPFADLVKMVSISKLQRFIALANVQFEEKQINRNVITKSSSNTRLQFEMTVFEKENLFLAKFKRKDERIKFVFKSIRKQLYNRFRNLVKGELTGEQIKNKFNQK